MLAAAYHGALALTVVASIGLAGLLARTGGGVAGGRALAVFVALVAVWVIGLETTPMLLAVAPLGGAAFLRFALTFGGWPQRRAMAAGLLPGAGAVAAAGLAAGMGTLQDGDITAYLPGPGGWLVIAVTLGLAGLGHGLLAVAWHRAQGLRRRQLAAVLVAGLWGLGSLSSLALPALGLPPAPVTVPLLPLYTVGLVYGILRYRLMEVNVWARRALAWGLVMAAAGVVVGVVAVAPTTLIDEAPGLTAVLAAVVALALGEPARRLADRLVYPGAAITPHMLDQWRRQLAAAVDRPDLAQRAAADLGGRLGLAVAVTWEHAAEGPALVLERDGAVWTCRPTGWDEAPPGPRLVAYSFAATLAEAAGRLDLALSLAARERERQQQERLAELGALAATVAHDLRNPLNIVAMAVAGADPATRREVAEQIGRMDWLVRDLLDYARPWDIAARRLDLADELAAAASGLPGLHLEARPPSGLTVHADPRRLRQVLINLLHNAGDAAVAVSAETRDDGAVLVHVCDRGPGIPEDIRDRLFQPFVSRRPGGTGLGLAIVAQVMAAHGGDVSLTPRPGWTTCITLRFPSPGVPA